MEYTKYKSSFNRVFFREISRITERKSIYLLSIFLPLLLFLILTFVYKAELVRRIPVAVMDLDHSSLSTTVTKFISSTSSMKIVQYCNSIEEIKEAFRDGKIAGAFVLPRNMEHNVKDNRETAITVYQNATNIITSNYILNDGSKIVKTVSAGVTLSKLKKKSVMEEQALAIVNPIRLDTQILFNANYSYESYIVPGLLISLLQMIIMVVAALLFASEFEHNTIEELIKTSNGSITSIILGKSLPHILIHICTMLFLVGFVFSEFNIVHYGSFLPLIALLIFFIIVSFFFGLAVSIVLKNQQTATEVVVFFNTPAFLFSGFTFPLWSMPLAHNLFAQVIPFTHLIEAYLRLFQNGFNVVYIMPQIRALFISFIVSLITIIFVLNRVIAKYKLVGVAENA